MKPESISNRLVRLVAPYFIGLFSLLSVSANNFTGGSTISSPVNPPVITLNVTDIQIIEVGSSYTELGATAQDNEDVDADLTSAITISGVSGVNTNVIGDYNVIYSVTDSDGNATSETRIIRVVDSQPPLVTFTGSSPISIEVGTTYYELGATATDNYDPSFSVTNSIVTSGTVTEEVVASYTITYSALDSSGNVGTVQRIVNVVDTTSPTIDITGDNPTTITLGATYNDEGATATDNYDTGLTVVVGGNTVDTSTVGSYTVTYNVSDESGNSAAQKVRIVNVVDDTDPIITLNGSSTITHEVGTTYVDPGATANDNYDGDLSSEITTNINLNPNTLGTYTIEYTVEDSSNNIAQEQRTVQVVDTVDPLINLVGDTTVSIEFQMTYTDAGATAIDNYDGNLNNSLTSSSTVNTGVLGTYLFTYTVSDSSSNTALVSRTVSVVDTTPPVITLNGPDEVNLQVGDSYSDGGATAVDAYDGDVTSDISTVSSVDTTTVGVYYVTYTVSDNEGNNTQATRTVVVGSPPVISLQGANPLQLEAGSTYVELGANAFDIPDGDVSDQISISESINTSVLGSYSVQYSIIDSDGNSTVLFRAVQVSDTTSPSIELIGNEQMTIEVNGSFADPGATATDTFEGDLTDQISDSGTVDTTSLGNYTITYQVSDSSGNTAIVSREVSVSDTTAPVISLTGSSPVTIEVGTTYADEGATATDDFQGDLTASISDISNVDSTTVGTYSVVYNVSDSSGNAANQVTRIVEVVDSQAPALSFVGGAAITHEAKTVFNIPNDVTATDVYDGDLTSAVVVSGIVNQDLVGSYNLSYSVTDSSGNTGQLSRTVNVVDTTNPEITLTGDNPLYINLGQTYIDPGYSASDNYDGNITSTVVESGLVDTSAEGTYFRNYNVSDSSSNAASQQIREVIVGSPPVITLNGNNPMYLEYQEVYVEPNATATDGGVNLSNSISISGSVNENQLGNYNIIYSVTDSDGNSVTETREVIVRDTTKPVITLNGDAAQTIEFGNSYNEEGAIATDNYDSSLAVTSSGTVNTSLLGTYTIDYQATDSQGNVADVVTRTVNLVDTQAPVMSLIGDLSQTIQVKSSYTELGVSTIDNYDLSIPFSSVTVTGSVDINTVGTYSIDYDVSDSSGNNAVTITRTVVVEDTEAPVIILAGDADITLEADSPYSDAGASVTDNYNTGLTASVDLSSLDLTTVGVYTLTYSVSDSSGNAATPVYRTITIVDTQAPTITLVGNPTIDIQAGTTYVDPGFTATDIYDGDLTAQVLVTGTVDTSILGAITLSYDVSDSSNNDAPTKTRTVRVVDTTKPVITLQGADEILLEVGDSFTEPGYTATDNYDGIITNNVIVANSVDTTTPGQYIITYNLVDSQGNIADEKTRTIVVGSPPNITLNGPSVITIEVGNTYTDQGALASDDDDGSLGSTSDTPSLISVNGVEDVNTGLIGTYYIQYSVTDSDGNTTIVQRTVNVVDTTPPTITLGDDSDIEIEVFSDPYVDNTIVTVSDNYDSATTLTPSDVVVTDNINENVVGTYTISFNLVDSSANAASTKIRTVRVVDTTAPELILIGDSTIFISKGSVYTEQGATATDNYDGVITGDVITSGNVNNNQIGTYTITYNVKDAAENPAAPITRTVTVGPNVDATATPNPACFGETVTLGSTNTDLVDENGDAYRFEWSATPSTGTLLDTQHIITVSVTQNTIFRLEVYDVNDVLVGSDESEVEVNPLPVYSIQSNTTLCAGDTIDLGDGINAETGFTYQWSSLNGYSSTLANPPPHTPTADDTFTLTVTSDAGCQDTQSFDVVVVDKPVISFIDDDFTICEGETFTITTGVATVQNSDNYMWSAPAGYGSFDSPTSLTPIFTPSEVAENAGVVTLTLTATDQSPCTGSKSESITLNITPLGNISLSPVNAVVCSSEVIELDISGANYDATSLVASPVSAIVNTATNKIFYSPTNTDIVNGFVDITVTASPLSPCTLPLTSPTQRINITPEAEVAIANSPLVVCYDPSTPQFFSLATIGATISNFDSFTWEDMGGGGSFSAGNTADPMSWSYQPGSNAIDTGSTQLKLTAVPNNPCSSTPEMEAFLTVILDQNPEIIVKTGDKILCEGVFNEITSDIIDYENDTQSSFAWTGGDGTFVSSSSKFPFYRPGPTDLSTGVVTLVVTVTPNSGGCSTAVSQPIEFIVNKNKIVNLGPSIDMCESDGTIFLEGDFITDSSSPPNVINPTTGITWGILNNDGDGTFSETTALNPVYTPGTLDIDRGQVTLQMTYNDGSCNDISDTVILNIVRTPFADLGTDIEICAGESLPIIGTIVRPAGASIQWGVIPDASGLSLQNDTSLFPTLVADSNASGNYQLTLQVNPEIIDGVNCGAQIVESVDVQVIPPPTVQLTGNPVICQGNDFTYDVNEITIAATNSSGFVWSTLGDGTFDGGNTTSTLERPTYTPGNSDINAGNVDLRLDVLPNADCHTGEYFDTINLEITPVPSIQGPNEIEFCKTNPLVVDIGSYLSVDNQNQFSYVWTSSSGVAAGTFSGSGLSATYTPSSFDIDRKSVVLTLVATQASCSASATKNITVYFLDLPEVDAGPDEVILCEDEVNYQTAGSYTVDPRVTSGVSYVWSTSGDGEFSPSNTETDPLYIPGPNDRLKRKVDNNSVGVQLTFKLVSTGTCEVEIQDSVELFFEPKPEISLPADFEICGNLTPSLSANVNGFVDESSYFWTTSGDGTFNGSDQNTSTDDTPTYFPGTNDLSTGNVTISVSVNGKNACSSTTVQDSQTITFIAQPTAEAGPETTICETGGVIDVENTVAEPATNYSQLEWTIVDGSTFGTINNANTLSPEFIPAADAVTQGFVTLQLTVYPTNHSTCDQTSGLCCGVATDTVRVNIQKEPVILIPSNQEICQNDTFTIFNDQVQIENIPSYTIQWTHDGAGVLTNSDTLTPTYTPTVSETGDVTLTMSITPANPNVCTGLDPVVRSFVLTIEPLPVVYAGDDITLCQGEIHTTQSADVDFTTNFQWSHDGFGSFTPNNSSENVTYTPNDQDYVRGYVVLTLTATPEGNCTGKPDVVDSFRITYSPPPTVEVLVGDTNADGVEEYPSSFCGSESYTFDAAQVVGQNVVSYNWETIGGDGTFSDDTDEQTPTYTPGDGDKANGSVTMRVTAVGQGGCAVDTFDFDLTILPEPTLDLLSSPSSVCIDSTINLEATTNLLAGDYNISWSVDAADGVITQGGNTLTPTFEPIRTGIVTITATLSSNDPCATQNIIKTVDVDVVGLPEISAFPLDDEICFDERVTVAGVTTNAFVDRVEWEARDENGNLVGTFSDHEALNPLYTPASFTSTELNENQVVTLTMTAYAITPCTADTLKSFTLTLTPAPKVNNADTLWGTASVCAGENDLYTTEVADLSHYESYAWTSATSADGEWFNQNSLQPSYRPSQDEIDAGEFTLVLTVNGNGVCDPIQEQKTIQIVDVPIVDLPTSLEVCHPATPFDPVIGFELTPDVLANFAPSAASTTGVKWSTGGSGFFSNNVLDAINNVNDLGDPSNSYSTIYYPSSDDYTNGQVIITLTAYPESPCATAITDTMTLTFTEEPTVNVGGPYSICEDGTTIDLIGTVINGNGLEWSTSTNGIFQNSGGSSTTVGNTTYELGSDDYTNGFVTLTLTAGGNGVCGPKTEQITIPITKKPVVEDPLGDIELCVGEIYEFAEISVVNYESYVWSTTDGNGTLTNTTSDSTGILKYTPDSNNLDTGTLEFYLTVTPVDPCLTPVTFTKRLIYYPEIEVNVQDPFEFCQDEGDSFTVTATANNYSNVQWSVLSPGSGVLTNSTNLEVTYEPSNADWRRGDVTLELTVQPDPIDICGPTTRQIVVDLIADPQVDISAGLDGSGSDDAVICLGQAHLITVVKDYTYDQDQLGPQRKSTYVWTTNGLGIIDYDPNDPTNNVTYLPDPADTVVDLTLTVTNPEDTTVVGGCDRITSDTLTLTVTPNPTADAGPNQTLCVGDDIVVAGTVTNEDSIQWAAYFNDTYLTTPETASGIFTTTGDYSTVFTPASDGVYQDAISRGGIVIELTAVSENSCGEVSDFMVAQFDQKPVILFGDQNGNGLIDGLESDITEITFCEGQSIDLSFIYPNVLNGQNYRWTSPSTGGTFNGNSTSNILNPIYEPSQNDIDTGSVVLRLEVDPTGACSSITNEQFFKEITVLIESNPTLDVIPVHEVCEVYFDPVANELKPTLFTIPGTTTNYPENIEWVTVPAVNNPYALIISGTENSLEPTVEIKSDQIPNDGAQVTLRAIVSSNCGTNQIIKDVLLNINPKPYMEINTSEEVCKGDNSYTLNTSPNPEVDYYQNVLWYVKSGNGIVEESTKTSLTPTYIPAANETGDVIITLTYDAVGECTFSSFIDYTLRIVDEPSVSLEPLSGQMFACNDDDYVLIQGTTSNSSKVSFSTVNAAGTFYTDIDLTIESSELNLNGDEGEVFNIYFQPTNEDKESGSVDVIVTAEPIGVNCSQNAIDVVNIEFNLAPIVDAGPEEIFVCDDSPVITLENAIVSNEVSFAWSTTGSGTFEGDPLNRTYIPSVSDLSRDSAADPIILTLSAVGKDGCSEASDEIRFTINKTPTVDIPFDNYEHCALEDLDLSLLSSEIKAFNYSQVEWSHDGEGDFENSNILKPIYKPEGSDFNRIVTLTVIVYGQGGCSAKTVEDKFEVEFSQPASVDYQIEGVTLTENLEICEGEDSILLDGVVYENVTTSNWTISPNTIDGYIGSGYFLNNGDITQPASYFPTETDFNNGKVTLTITVSNDGDCDPVDKSIVLDLIKRPVITTNNTLFSVCESDPQVQITGVNYINAGKLSVDPLSPDDILWTIVRYPDPVNSYKGQGEIQPGTETTNTPIYIPAGNDFDNSVFLQLTVNGQGDCPNFIDTKIFEIRFVDEVIIDAGSPGSICEGEDFQVSGAQISGISINNVVWRAVRRVTGGPDVPADGSFDYPNSLLPIYTPGPQDIANGEVKLILESTGASNVCGNDDDYVLVQIDPIVDVYAGPDFEFCSTYNGGVIDINGWSSRFNSSSWVKVNLDGTETTTGITEIGDADVRYTLQPEDISDGSVTLRITSSGSGQCSVSGVDDVTITISEGVNESNSSAGELGSICSGESFPININNDVFLDIDGSDIESIEWKKGAGANGDITNPTSLLGAVYVPSTTDSNVTLELHVTLKSLPAVSYTMPDGRNGVYNFNCNPRTVILTKELIVASDLINSGASISGGDNPICTDAAFEEFSITNLDNAITYNWTIPSNATLVDTIGDGKTIHVSFENYTQNVDESITVTATNGCSGQVITLNKDIEIYSEPLLTLDSATSTEAQELCLGDDLVDIVYLLDGGAKNLQSELEITFFDGANEISALNLPISNFSFDQLSNVVTTSGKYTDATQAGIYTYQIKYADTESCFTTDILAQGSLTLRAPPTLSLSSVNSSENQGPICSGDDIIDIEYDNTGVSVMISWSTGAKPIGIEYNQNANPFVISGSPVVQPGEASSTFTYTIVPIDSSGCEGLPQSGSIIVDAPSPVEPSNLNLNNEIYCEGENVSFTFFLSDNLTAPLPITYTTQDYDISGAPDGPADISGINPPGFVPYWDFNQSKLIISGAPSSGPNVRRSYSFEIDISSQANACTTALTTNPGGSFFISQSPTLSLYGNQLDINGSQEFTGNKNQALCESIPLKPIFIKVDGTNNAPVATGLPIGISQPTPHPDDPTVYILEGTPSNSNSENEYNYEIVLESEYGCTETFTGTIYLDKNYDIILESAPLTANQEICGNSNLQPISYRYTPGIADADVLWSVYEIGNPTVTNNQKPSGISVNDSGSVITIDGSASAIDINGDGTINQNIVSFTILTTTPNGCTDTSGSLVQESKSGEFKVTPLPTLVRTSPSATASKCEGEYIEIEFEASSNVQPIITWSQNLVGNNLIVEPATNNVWRIKGTIDNITDNLSLDYSLIMKDITSQCESVPVLGTVYVENKHELNLISGSNLQDICEGSDINPIVYEYSGGASSVQTSTLPSGLTPSIDSSNKTITISGTPTSQISADTQKVFTIQTLGSGGLCEKVIDTIKINLTPKPRFANAALNYIVCEGESLPNIEFGLLDGANEVNVSWDKNPSGIIDDPVDFTIPSNPIFRFSGTPTGVTEDTVYTYTLTAFNSLTNCQSDSIQGTITVENSHQLTRNIGPAEQEICEGEDIQQIVYQWGGGATSAQVIGLPAGLRVDTDANNNTVTISGSPTMLLTQDENLEFVVQSINNSDSCNAKVDTLSVRMIKKPSIQISSGSRVQTGICEGDSIAPIEFRIFDGATNPVIVWDNNISPPGSVYLEETDTANGIYTLQGAIDGFANDQTYNYSIKSINQSKGCESIEITGSLSVQKGHKLVRTQGSNNQTICEGEAIEPITFKFSEGAVSASPVNIPPGLDWIINGDELLISGIPISTDVDELTIKTFVVESIGNSCTPDPQTVTISIEPDAEVNLESPAQTRIQDVCQGFAIEDITYSFAGGAVDVIWNGLPSGLEIEKVYDLIDPDKISRLDITGTPNIAVLTDTTFDYTIKALNSNGCNQQEQTGSITVKANAELSLLSTSLSQNQTVCVGEDILPINIGYENSLPPSVSGMPAGLYTDNATPGVLKIRGQVDDLQLGNPNRTITVVGTNTNGCQSQEIIININVEPSFDIKPAIEVQNPLDVGNPSGASFVKNITCYDSNDGEILVNLEGGSSTTVYNYVWNGPNNYVNTTQNNHIKNLSKGTYIVEVEAQGARGCSITQTYTITEPEPINIIENEIRPVTCTGSEDGLISVTVNGGNDNFYRNFIWEVLQENQSCTTYTIRLRDNDNDGIFDIIDADKNNDGILDEPGTDDNANGIIDDADNDTNYSFGIVRYQSCDGLDVKNNIIRGEFSANGIYQICAIPNTVSAEATLDHDLDPSTQPIAPVTISGGTSSCSAGTWTRIDRLKGSSLASGLDEGIYRLTVVEGPDLNDIESNDLESLRNNPDMCIEERIFELPKDQILYGSVRVDDTYCSLSGGYIDIDVNQSAGDIYFIYDGVRVPSTDVEIIAAEFAINTYRVLIQNPNSNGSFEIRNATGCGVVVAQDLLDTNVITPIINYSSPELDKYGTISERSNVLFTLAGNTSYYRVEWDFGDASPIAAGERVSHQYFADGTYTVTVYVYNASGCFTSSTKEIIIGKGYTILMPNAFSPNGDNINEIIGPVFTGLKAVEFYIYNSQGILIYQEFVSEDNLSPNGTIEIMGWDGENSDPSSNFYIYKIIGTRINEELVTRTGTIFLIE